MKPAAASPQKATTRWERKAEERPEALFNAALDVFSKQGYRAARLEDVASAAGVSKGTIYRYFVNKEDLLEKSLEYRRSILFLAVETALEEFQGTAAQKLRYFLQRCWEKCRNEDWGRFHKLMFGEIATELPELFESWARQSLMQGWRLLENVIRSGQASGEFRADADAKALSRFLYSGLSHQGLLRSHMGFTKFDPMPQDRIFTASLDLALRGLQHETQNAPANAPKKSSGKKT